MKKTLLQLSKIVGTSTETSWSQIHTFTPEEKEKIRHRGQLLAVFSLSSLGEEIEVVTFGRETIARLHEEYYGTLFGSPLDQLKQAVRKVSLEFGEKIQIEIAAAAVVGEVLYIAIRGEGRLILARSGRKGTVLSGTGAASGYLKEGDIFLLATGDFFEIIAEGSIQAALASGSPQEATEMLAPMVHGQRQNKAVSCLIARVRMEEEEKEATFQTREVEKEKRMELKKRLNSPLGVLARKAREVLFQIKKRAKEKVVFWLEKRKKTERSQKMVITVALILLLLLGISVVLGTKQRRHLGKEQQAASFLEKARTKKNEGEALIELNPLKAKKLLLEAQGLIQEVEKKEATNEDFVQLKKELEALLARVLREHKIEPRVYFDLELIKAGAKGDDWDVSTGKLIILDKDKSSVYSLGISDKKSAILAGGEELRNATKIATFLPKIFILTKEGVVQINETKEKKSLVVPREKQWKEVVDIQAFGGNLYLLERKGEIWKYPGVEEGFASRRRWLKNKTAPNFLDAISMAIDGSIWVLDSGGSILKFTQGIKDIFRVAGLDKPFSNPSVIYTNEDLENLYVLDKGNLRVVVLNKSGEYHSSYVWEGIKDISQLAASEKEKKILLLGGSKIYEIEIK